MATDQQIAVAARAVRLARSRLRTAQERLATVRANSDALVKEALDELATRTEEFNTAAAAMDAAAAGT